MAEVLITLVVLGIIAAVTIPTLRNSLDEKKYKVPLKKTYSVLSEAFDSALKYKDITSYDSYLSIWKIVDELAVGKICCNLANSTYGTNGCLYYSGDGDKVFGNCFVRPKSPDNQNKFMGISGAAVFELKDGTSIIMRVVYRKSSTGIVDAGIAPFRRGYPTSSDQEAFFIVWVDVNGKAGPNIAGKDVHAFVYTDSDGLLPAGVDANTTDTSIVGDCNGDANWGCTYDYLFSDED